MKLRRAFSLLELMVATTMAIVVVTAATIAIFIIIRALNQSGQSSAADNEAQLVSEYLVSQLQGIGGGAVRPWMAVVIDNNSGENGSDVVTFADVPVDLPPSISIVQRVGPGTYSFLIPEFTRNVSGVRVTFGRCPLAELRKDTDGDGFPQIAADTSAAYSVAELKNRDVVLTSPTGDTWRSVVVTNLQFGDTVETCVASFAVASGTDLVANGALARADRFSGTLTRSPRVEDPDEWVLGQMSFVRVRQWRFHAVGGEVGGQVLERITGSGGFGADRILLEGARDLQVSPGYDHDPFNGVVGEAADGKNDEWLNSVPGDDSGVFNVLPRDLESPDPDIPQDTLRMLDIAVIIALPRAERGNVQVRAFDGTPKFGPEARVTGGRAFLRNQLLFL